MQSHAIAIQLEVSAKTYIHKVALLLLEAVTISLQRRNEVWEQLLGPAWMKTA